MLLLLVAVLEDGDERESGDYVGDVEDVAAELGREVCVGALLAEMVGQPDNSKRTLLTQLLQEPTSKHIPINRPLHPSILLNFPPKMHLNSLARQHKLHIIMQIKQQILPGIQIQQSNGYLYSSECLLEVVGLVVQQLQG